MQECIYFLQQAKKKKRFSSIKTNLKWLKRTAFSIIRIALFRNSLVLPLIPNLPSLLSIKHHIRVEVPGHNISLVYVFFPQKITLALFCGDVKYLWLPPSSCIIISAADLPNISIIRSCVKPCWYAASTMWFLNSKETLGTNNPESRMGKGKQICFVNQGIKQVSLNKWVKVTPLPFCQLFK